MKRLFVSLLMGGLFLAPSAVAQDGTNQVSYLNLAQQFSLSNTNGDPGASILPSVAIGNAYGSYIDNPASVAMLTQSYFNFGYLGNFSSAENGYLGNSFTQDNQLGRLSNLGILYSHPTSQGSLVFGGGYTITNSANRDNFLSSLNNSSTITDAFVNPGSQYNSIAYETYAIDFLYEDLDDLGSIFRIGYEPGEFDGIYQDAEISQRTRLGEFSFFGATEFARNFYVGASFSIMSGNYSYERKFLERDLDNIYNGDFLFADDEGLGGTDVDNVLLEDEIDSEILGSTIRAGAAYKVLPFLNIGASYTLPTRLFVSETYYSSIQTTFDDNTYAFDWFDNGLTAYEYEIKQPGQMNLGVAIEDVMGFTLSGSVELIDYRNTEVDLTTDSDLDFEQVTDLRVEEAIIDSTINADYNLVTNMKIGGKYVLSNGLELRTGLQFLPAKSDLSTSDKILISGGFGIYLTNEIYLDVTTQYSQWDDRSIVYEYTDMLTGELISETVAESFSEVNVLVGLRFSF